MMRRILALILSLSIAAPALARTPSQQCTDAIVVAKLLRQTPTTMPTAGPDELIIRWPWLLTFEVEQSLAGRPTHDLITVVASLHVGFNPKIKHHLLFLEGRHGVFGIIHHEYRVASDRQGRFVVPLADPVEREWLAPDGWIPPDYQAHLKGIRYAVPEAWWLNEPGGDEQAVNPEWATRRDGKIVAKRGLILEDMDLTSSPSLCRKDR